MIKVDVGDRVKVNLHNKLEVGTDLHLHLHRFDQIVIAKDGFPLDSPYTVDTLNVAPGERYSFWLTSTPREPGSGTAISCPTSRRTTACSGWSRQWW